MKTTQKKSKLQLDSSNRWSAVVLCVALSGTFCISALAADYEVINPSFTMGLDGWKTGAPDKTFEVVPVEGQDFSNAVRVQFENPPAKPWQIQLRQPVKTNLYPGEKIEISAMVRSPENLDVSLALQSTKPPFDAIVFKRGKSTIEWQRMTLTGKTPGHISASESQIAVTMGYGAGTLEISDIKVSFPERESITDQPPSFAELNRDSKDLKQVNLDAYPLPGKGEMPPGPYLSMIGGVEAFVLQGKKFGSLERGTASDQPFTDTVILKTTSPTEAVYNFQLRQPLIQAAVKGDTLYAVFSYRMLEANPETGYAALVFAIEEIGGRYGKVFQAGVTMHDKEWHHTMIPFRTDSDLGAGAVQLAMQAGFGPQTVEIGAVALINFKDKIGPWKLKRTPMQYGGESQDAAWRAAAEERITKLRKGNFELQVKDSDGNPVTNAKLKLQLKNRPFRFGSVLNEKALLEGGEKFSPEYGHAAEQLFDVGSLENAMKWPLATTPGIDEKIEKSLRWMEERDWRIRGHTLVWPGWRHMPESLQELKGDPKALQAAVLKRVKDTAGKYRGRIDDWDVINEPYKNHDLMDILGRESMHQWLQSAHEADPEAKLFINDFDLLTRPGSGNPRIPYYMDLIAFLQSQKSPLHGIGLQSHFVGILTPIEHVEKILDQFAKTGLTIQLTELTVNIPDEFTQAKYTEDLLTLAFSHPAVNLVQSWGFWEGRMFEKEAAMYRLDWSPKPLQKAYDKLVNTTFSTDLLETTDAEGKINFNGFYGLYNVTLPGSETPVATVTFSPETTKQTVTIDKEGTENFKP